MQDIPPEKLIRILLYHPEVEITFIHSTSNAGNPIHAIHQDLIGETNLYFTDKVNANIDVLFVCAGHGKTKPFLAQHTFPDSLKVIDLSRDFRLKAPEHNFVYGLPELNRAKIKTTSRLANPGCFATCIQLAALPLASQELIQDELHVHAITGSTGAGQQPLPTTHFSWRNNNLSIYKAFKHQHLGEIQQSIQQLDPQWEHPINFLPLRGDFARGIFASTYLNCPQPLEEIQDIYQQYYEDHPFVHITDQNPSLKQVVNTNKCILHLEKATKANCSLSA